MKKITNKEKKLILEFKKLKEIQEKSNQLLELINDKIWEFDDIYYGKGYDTLDEIVGETIDEIKRMRKIMNDFEKIK